MMYKEQLAVAIKVGDQVLREFGDKVYVPFGSEYKILIKNENSVRAQVRVTVDGQDATEGVSLIVRPGQSMDLERFIKNQNLNEGNKFKFIERTAKVEKHRGIGISDGLIRVEFQYEKPQPKPVYIPTVWTLPEPMKPWNPRRRRADDYPSWTLGSNNVGQNFSGNLGSSGEVYGDAVGSMQMDSMPEEKARGISATSTSGEVRAQNYSANSVKMSKSARPASLGLMSKSFAAQPEDRWADAPQDYKNDVGVTVPGGVSGQKFFTASWFEVESTLHVINLQLLGSTEQGQVVRRPVTVKRKVRCVTCNHLNKQTAKFCSECSTGLDLVVA